MGPMTVAPSGKDSDAGASGPVFPRIPGVAGDPGLAGLIVLPQAPIGLCGALFCLAEGRLPAFGSAS